MHTIYNLESFTRLTFNCIFEAFTVRVLSVFGLESMSEISSCAPGLMIHGVEVLFLSPVGYVSLQSLSPGVMQKLQFCSAVEDAVGLYVSSISLSSPSFQLQLS